jgi:hypothetical protein
MEPRAVETTLIKQAIVVGHNTVADEWTLLATSLFGMACIAVPTGRQ